MRIAGVRILEVNELGEGMIYVENHRVLLVDDQLGFDGRRDCSEQLWDLITQDLTIEGL